MERVWMAGDLNVGGKAGGDEREKKTMAGWRGSGRGFKEAGTVPGEYKWKGIVWGEFETSAKVMGGGKKN